MQDGGGRGEEREEGLRSCLRSSGDVHCYASREMTCAEQRFRRGGEGILNHSELEIRESEQLGCSVAPRSRWIEKTIGLTVPGWPAAPIQDPSEAHFSNILN